MDNRTPILILYTNHRGETAMRRILPLRIFFGVSIWHSREQWLLEAYDVERIAERTFAMREIHGWYYPAAEEA